MIAIAAVGADEGSQRDNARLGEQVRDRTDAANVLFTILGREAESESLAELLAVPFLEHGGRGVQAVADVVAVEDETVFPLGVELVVNQVGDGTFAAGRQSGEPDDAPFVTVEFFVILSRNLMVVPYNLNVLGHRRVSSLGFERGDRFVQ